ncbi:hypothetical protein CHS0354_021708 [Potamilus streckersoni]|uniref:FYVE, RhoGEF and PH domain-containing protein 4 n=1 Tax=Potamilus streckersoni TaxID=2493646 RepID=A0AAE0WEU2_9BIVA|nr:hypothetical protein CHS0354_021708 [Potamilus streckersoni]
MEKGYVRTLVEKINHHGLTTDVSEETFTQNDSCSRQEDSSSLYESQSCGDIDCHKRVQKLSESISSREGSVCKQSDTETGHRCLVNSENIIGAESLPINSNGADHSLPPNVEVTNTEEEEEEEPKCKLYKIAEELLNTERSYVSRLHLLDQVFHFKITVENKNAFFMPEEIITQMFSNIKSIYKFHNDFLLPQLTERMLNWSKEAKIGDLMKKFAPFLKMYTEYVKNFDHAMELINQWLVKSPRFATLIQDIQQLPECGHLTLQHHMLEPVQRVPRYELLLKDYLKRLPEDASDRTDAEVALKLVTEAASHSNTVMKKIEKFHKVMSIYQALGGGIDLISPTRELIKEGRIIKISARSGEKQDRYLFLFNDLLLVCSEQILGSYKLRARMSVEGMEVLHSFDENHFTSKSFMVKSVEKSVEFLEENSKSGEQEWETVIHKVISDFKLKSFTRAQSNSIDSSVLDDEQDKTHILGKKAPQWIKDDAVTMCMVCTQQFTALKRRHHCRACGRVVCGKCSPRKIRLEYDNSQLNKVCINCYDVLSKDNTPDLLSEEDSKKKGILQKAACEPSIISGYLNVLEKGRNWSRRWIALRSDFVMYLYKAHQDVVAMTALPLPGYNTQLVEESEKIDKSHVFKLCHKNLDTFYFQADTETKVKQWVKVLEKMVLLKLPDEDDVTDTNRLSSTSTSSTTSTNSDC